MELHIPLSAVLLVSARNASGELTAKVAVDPLIPSSDLLCVIYAPPAYTDAICFVITLRRCQTKDG
jgi:hypothetical protein